MIGALVGYKAMQKENPDWIEKVLKCEPVRGRGPLFRPIIAIQKTFQLIQKYI